MNKFVFNLQRKMMVLFFENNYNTIFYFKTKIIDFTIELVSLKIHHVHEPLSVKSRSGNFGRISIITDETRTNDS